MEKERERVAAEERSALNSVLERLHKQYQAMHQRNTKERVRLIGSPWQLFQHLPPHLFLLWVQIELQTEIEGLRQQLFHSHFKERGEGSAVEYPPMPAGHQLLEHSPGGATGHGTRKSPTGYPPPRSPTVSEQHIPTPVCFVTRAWGCSASGYENRGWVSKAFRPDARKG